VKQSKTKKKRKLEEETADPDDEAEAQIKRPAREIEQENAMKIFNELQTEKAEKEAEKLKQQREAMSTVEKRMERKQIMKQTKKERKEMIADYLGLDLKKEHDPKRKGRKGHQSDPVDLGKQKR